MKKSLGTLGLCLLLCLVATSAFALDAPAKLVYAMDGNWYTSGVFVNDNATAPASFKITDCQIGPIPGYTVAAGNSLFVRSLGDNLCNWAGFKLLDAPAGVTASTFLRYQNLATRTHIEFELPTLTYALTAPGEFAMVSPVWNDGDDTLNLATFNDAPGPAFLQIQVFDHTGVLKATESTVTPGAGQLGFYEVQTRIDFGGYLIVSQGSQVGCTWCNTPGVVYGFAVVGPADNASPVISPLRAGGIR